MTNRQQERLKSKAARLLRAAAVETDPALRTTQYRALAEAIFDIRESFILPNGEPDWRGKSYAYRQAMGDVYSAASLTPDELAPAQVAVRYHISNVLRERLDEETLRDIGLRPESARERSREIRVARSAIIDQARDASAPLSAAKSIHGAAALLRRITPEDLAGLSETERRGLASALHTAEEAAKALLDALSAPRR